MNETSVQQYLNTVKASVEAVENVELDRVKVRENPNDSWFELIVYSGSWTLSIMISMDLKVEGKWWATFSGTSNSPQRSYALTLLVLIDAVEGFNAQQG